jgi:hypothetical protein
MATNIYFDLTRLFNAEGDIAVLASGQAVVYYKVAIMSKDGDWILEESDEACRRIRKVLGERGARYRPGAPLDVRWLSGGWSSHFELFDEKARRVRCDFFSRPPRVPRASLERLFSAPPAEPGLPVVDLVSLVQMKRTQRAKDYAVIAELSRLLPPEEEAELTSDADRLLELAASGFLPRSRAMVQEALAGGSRDALIVALARETDELQRKDRSRLDRYAAAAEPFVEELRRRQLLDLPLGAAHEGLVALATELLPRKVDES